MQRMCLILLRMFFPLLYLIVRLEWYSKPKHRNHEKSYELISRYARYVVSAGNVEVEIKGAENIPQQNGFIFYPNHQGLFDVLLFLISCPKPFAFVIKKESSTIPLLKQVIGALGSIPMDRSDIRQSMEVIHEVTERVKAGENFLIFAEGTRSRKGNELLEMKGGSFKAAMKAKCPVVPCALIDSYKPLDEKGIKHIKAKLIYLPPITYEQYKDMRSQELAELVKKQIEHAIKNETECISK